MKKCYRCGEEKEITEFYKDKSRKDGLCNRCKDCSRELDKSDTKKESDKRWKMNNKEKVSQIRKRHYNKHRDTILEKSSEYKKNNRHIVRVHKKNNIETLRKKCLEYKGCTCVDCGKVLSYPKDKGKYDFHHTDPTDKKFNISRMTTKEMGWSRIIDELEKCVLLCQSCHRKRHKDFNSGLRDSL
jgi:hypothetical protein